MQQKVESDFRTTLQELHRLSVKDPARAAERMKQVLAVLEEDTVLSEHKREAWKRMLRDRIRSLQTQAQSAAKEEKEKAERTVAAEDRRALEERKAAEEQKFRDQMNTVRRLQNEGRLEEANRLAAEAARRNPGNAAAEASRRITGTAEAINQMRDLKRERERRFDLALRDVERSAMPPIDDIEFPSPEKWREITKKRTKTQMTAREKAIMEALEKPITANLKGMTFESAIDYLQTVTGLTIMVDKATLDAAGITYETPVSTNLKNVSTRTFLRKLLADVGLTYVIKNEAVQVVTPAQARDMLTVRTYYLGDLAGAVDLRFGPVINQLQMQETVNNIMQMIVSTIEPDTWAINNNGGKGQIWFDARTLTLIVKQSAEVHYMLGGGR
jgi:hypothetical protein